jgi:ATP-dependent Lhr-like helicase
MSQRPLQRINRWFQSNGWHPFAFQKRCWSAHAQGKNGLVYAPTGIGKTYAAWLGPVMAWMGRNQASQNPPPIQVLWLTPLRALAADTCDALRLPVRQLDLPWTVELRTGDSPASLKRRQKDKLPSALVTTPESLSLMLSYPESKNLFKSLSTVVVDEWHELIGSKRGVQTQLALARLRRWNPLVQTWGLSATIGNTDVAMQALLPASEQDGVLIKGRTPRQLDIQTIIPPRMARFPWSGHLGLNLLPQVVAVIERTASALVFTNTRSQTETWYQAILDRRPDWAGIVALHHGSLDKGTRRTVETMLREGRLKCVVCTSSLDLGVDFSPVDHVLQIGSPKGIARLMQRAGRSGHRPGRTSRITCVPTHAFELIEIAAARRAIANGSLEPRWPIMQPLDVLAQHMVSVALGGGFKAHDLFAEVRSTFTYHMLSRRKFDWVRRFVTTGGSTLGAYPEYARVVRRRHGYRVENPTIARRHRMSIGTITSDAAIGVKYMNGRRLGTVEERFISRLKRGDRFQFAGRTLEYVRIKDMTVWVRKATGGPGRAPQWLGGRMPLSSELAGSVRFMLDRAAGGHYDFPEIVALGPILALQARWSVVPGKNDILVETWRSQEGWHLFVYPFEGLLVNEGLATLVGYRLTKRSPITFSITANDYGFELLSDRPLQLPTEALKHVFRPMGLMTDILASLNASEMARRQFREIARVAGLVFQGYPGGRQKSSHQLQASSSLLYNVFQRYDPQNLLLKQATEEILDRQLEFRRLKGALQRLSAGNLRALTTDHPTPLAFPILASRLRATLSSEKLAERIQRLQIRLEKAASSGAPRP